MTLWKWGQSGGSFRNGNNFSTMIRHYLQITCVLLIFHVWNEHISVIKYVLLKLAETTDTKGFFISGI